MSRHSARRAILLAYPLRWRLRYEDELLAYLDDEFSENSMGLAAAASLLVGGMTERCRTMFAGATRAGEPGRSSRGLSLLVWGWFCCVLGGVGFAKLAEHFPARASGASVSYTVVVAASIAAFLAVAALAVPGLLVAWSAGGQSGRARLRRAATVCAGTTLVAAAALAGLVLWAHRLAPAERGGSDARYGWAALLVALLIAIALAAATHVATTAFALVRARRRASGVSVAAWTAAACQAGVAGAAGLWWASLARAAPGFLSNNLSVGRVHAVVILEALFVVGAILSAVGGCLVTDGRASARPVPVS